MAMNMRSARVILVVAGLMAPLQAQPELPREVLLLARIRRQAGLDLTHIPSFTCLETIGRFSWDRSSAPWRRQDALQLDVAHIGAKELFAWPGSANFEDRPLAEIVGTGMVSSGEFTSFARDALLATDSVAHYGGEEELRGRRMARYDYDIAQAFSGLSVSGNGRRARVGEHGSFWADVESYELARLNVSAVEIPDGLGIESVGTEIEYQRVHMAQGDYLLPQRATTRMRRTAGGELRNEIEFTHCRQFAAESVLSFSDVTAAESGATPEHKEETRIPARVVIRIRLETPIASATAKVGDAVSAVVEANAVCKGAVVAPEGAVLAGRLRMLQKEAGRYVVGFEFTDLTWGDKHARFLARLESVDARYARLLMRSVHEEEITNPEGDSVKSTTIREAPVFSLPGVGTFFVPGSSFVLPRGMRMEWVTVELGHAK